MKEGLRWREKNAQQALAPLVLIPGLTGSNLQAKLTDAKPPSILCPKNSDWKILWCEVPYLARPVRFSI